MTLHREVDIGNAAQILINLAPSNEFAAGVASLALALGATVQLPERGKQTTVVIEDPDRAVTQ